MPQLSGSLQPRGALVEVIVGLARQDVQALHRALRPVPQPATLTALIDTGADATCLDPAIVNALHLPVVKIGLGNMPAAGGLTVATEHRAGVTIPHPSGQRRW